MAVKVKKVKLVTKIEASDTSFKTVDQIMYQILTNMMGHYNGSIQTFPLLTGDVGIGKTSILKTIARVMGMSMFIIEAPSISEEDLIEIPYIVLKAGRKQEQEGVLGNAENMEVDITYVENKIIQQLKKLKSIPFDKIESTLVTNTERKLFNKYKNIIQKLKEKYEVIMFLDEAWRANSKKILNLLRNLLNGKIGNKPLPDNTYVVFATNVKERGNALDDIPMNQEFKAIDADKFVTNDTFVGYYKDKIESEIAQKVDTNKEEVSIEDIDDPIIKNKVKTLEAVQKTLVTLEKVDNKIFQRDEDIEYEEEAPSRISPRRLEYISDFVANYYPKNEQDLYEIAYYLVTTLDDYRTGNLSSKIGQFIGTLLGAIAEQEGISVDIEKLVKKVYEDKYFETSRDILDKKLEMALNGEKTLPTVLASPPGTGKTTTLRKIARSKGAALIEIDASSLNPDDVKEINILGNDGKIINKPAPLYQRIMEEYEKYKKEGYNKIILFIDEFNRSGSQKVFNGIRQLLLDKKIATKKLPNDLVIVSAMNPNDKGTAQLTYHTEDVLDILPFSTDPTKLIDYTVNHESIERLQEVYKIDLKNYLKNFLADYLNSITSYSIDGTPYNLEIEEEFYISPRTYTEWIRESVSAIELNLMMMDVIDQDSVKIVLLQELTNQFDSRLTDLLKNRLKFDDEIYKSIADKLLMLIENIARKYDIGMINNGFINYIKEMKEVKKYEELKYFFEAKGYEDYQIEPKFYTDLTVAVNNLSAKLVSAFRRRTSKVKYDYVLEKQIEEIYEVLVKFKDYIAGLIERVDVEYKEELKNIFNKTIIEIEEIKEKRLGEINDK